MYINDASLFVNYVKQLIQDSPINNFFQSNTSYYDSLTHYYLGEYLRYLKDTKSLDLLSLYNVWGGNLLSNLKLQVTRTIEYDIEGKRKIVNAIQIVESKENELYDLMQVMIRPNTDYTIYIDSDMPIMLTSAAVDKNSVLTNETRNSFVIPSCQISKPFLYRVDIDDTDKIGSTDILRDYLSLLIYIPKKHKNRVILEGNYLNKTLKLPHTYNNKYQELLKKPDIQEFLEIYKYPKAFSDYLISYLLQYAITDSDDEIKNIERIQQYISSVKFFTTYKKWYTKAYTKGELDESMRRWLYDFKESYKQTNNLGYVDKDLEQLLIRGYGE